MELGELVRNLKYHGCESQSAVSPANYNQRVRNETSITKTQTLPEPSLTLGMSINLRFLFFPMPNNWLSFCCSYSLTSLTLGQSESPAQAGTPDSTALLFVLTGGGDASDALHHSL